MAQYDINLREYWRIIRKRKAFVILVTAILTIFSAGLAIIRAPSPVYEATSTIKFEKSVSPLGLYAKVFSWGPGSDIETQMAVIKSYPVFQKVALAMGLTGKAEDSDTRLGQVITNLQSQVKVTQEGYSNIVNITVTATSPEFAAALANQVALAYKQSHAQEINQRTAEAIKFIKGQLEVVGERLGKSEEELKRFREDHNIVALTTQSSNLLSRANSVETRLAEIMEAKRELEDVMNRIKEAPSNPLSSTKSFSSEKASALYQKLNSRLIDLMIKRDALLVQFTSSHPQLVEVNKQILKITQKMITELESQLNVQADKGEKLSEQSDIIKQEIQSLPTKGLELSRLEREVDRANQVYSLLESKYQEALIQDAEKPEEVTIVRPAFEPSKPINPPDITSSALLGAMIGLVLGLVFAFIVETFDTSLGAIEDVEETIGLPVLGLIPHIEPKDIQPSLKDKYKQDIADDTLVREARLIPNFGPQSILAESFRSLRTNIQTSLLEKNIKSIVVTSASPLEGKTSVAANLAISMAQGGLRSLLVDADLRKPTIHTILGLDTSPGVTEYLLSNYDLSETVRTVTDVMMGEMSMDRIMLTPGIDNLHIMTCGTVPLNPAELMQSDKFKSFMEEVHNQYDVILLDTPPLISAADASILAMNADGVLLVYMAGKVARGILKRAKAQLEQVKANIIGVVLNGVKAEISLDYDKYYRYYYYGQEVKKRKRNRKKGGL
ncbi:MAG: GumC family protein [Desulfatiglandales bacterium]